MKFKRLGAKKLVFISMTAALYAVLTVAIAPISYGAVQFRLSEIMTLLAFIDPIYAPGLILGCAIANLFSPLGWIDVVVGTTGTILSMIMIVRSKNLFTASLWPTVFCILVGTELHYIFKLPFIETTFYVMLGEFLVVTVVGYPLFKILLRNKKLIEILKINRI